MARGTVGKNQTEILARKKREFFFFFLKKRGGPSQKASDTVGKSLLFLLNKKSWVLPVIFVAYFQYISISRIIKHKLQKKTSRTKKL